MEKNRLEAFSDGVLAIIITIMVLELKAPESYEWKELQTLWPKFLAYLLSFTYVSIYWINHHHLFQSVSKVDGKVLWINLLLLFCLSLVPFAADWMGENHFASNPVMLYGIVLSLSGLSFVLLFKQLHSLHEKESVFHKAIGNSRKSTISSIIQITGIAAAYLYPLLGMLCYTGVAIWWIMPNKKIEELLDKEK